MENRVKWNIFVPDVYRCCWEAINKETLLLKGKGVSSSDFLPPLGAASQNRDRCCKWDRLVMDGQAPLA